MPLAIITFIKKINVKYLLMILGGLILLPFLFSFFKKRKSESEAASENISVANQLYLLHVDVLNSLRNTYSDRTYSLSNANAFDVASKIANFLGTHKDSTSWSEDEESTVNTLTGIKNGDFILVAYLYKTEYSEEQNELIGDLKSYLSSSQYEQLTHLF